MNTLHKLLLYSLLLIVFKLNATEKFLSGALDEDKALKEIEFRINAIKEKQEESNVFSTGEIKVTTDTVASIEKVRNENIGTAITNLEKTIENNTENKRQYYDNAQDEYEKAIKNMDNIYNKQVKDLIDKQGNYELLKKQKQLLDDMKEFQKKMNQKENLVSEKDLDKIVEISEKQDELKEETGEKTLKKMMEEASEYMKNMKIPQTIAKQEEILEIMKENIDSELPKNDESKEADMEKMEQQISEMEQKLEDSTNGKKPMTNEERQDLAMDMSEMAEKMKQENGKSEKKEAEPAGKMEEAMMNVLQENDKQALNALKEAQKTMQEQIAKNKKGKEKKKSVEVANISDKESKNTADGSFNGEKNQGVSGSDWTASLPAKERAALLAAHKANFSQDMELPVRKYFKELAK